MCSGLSTMRDEAAFGANEQNDHFHEDTKRIYTGTYFSENGAQIFFQGRALSNS